MYNTVPLGNQKVLTKDCISLFINSYATYRITNVEVAFKRLGTSYEKIVKTVSQGALKNLVGDFTMEQLLQNSNSLRVRMIEQILPKLEPFGIEVSIVEIQNMTLPRRLQELMDMVIETQQQTQAKILGAQADLDTCVTLRQSADELSKNVVSIELQYYDLLKEMTKNGKSAIFLPDSVLGMDRAGKFAH